MLLNDEGMMFNSDFIKFTKNKQSKHISGAHPERFPPVPSYVPLWCLCKLVWGLFNKVITVTQGDFGPNGPLTIARGYFVFILTNCLFKISGFSLNFCWFDLNQTYKFFQLSKVRFCCFSVSRSYLQLSRLFSEDKLFIFVSSTAGRRSPWDLESWHCAGQTMTRWIKTMAAD